MRRFKMELTEKEIDKILETLSKEWKYNKSKKCLLPISSCLIRIRTFGCASFPSWDKEVLDYFKQISKQFNIHIQENEMIIRVYCDNLLQNY